MDVVAIAGCGSGSGKTLLVERLLAGPLSGWGALKTTPDPEPDAGRGEYAFVTETEILEAPGSDTRRYLEAGASRVGWLAARRAPDAAETTAVLSHFAGLAGLAIEGIRLARPFEPAAWILVARAGVAEIKPSAEELLASATWLVVNAPRGEVSGGLPGAVRRRIESAGAGFAFTLDLADPGDAGTAALAGAVTAWLRWRRGTPSPWRPRC